MGYTLGVSTGLFMIAKSADPESRQDYIGIPRKALWSITKGVNFAQVDLESLSEFIEPDIDERVKELKRLGVEFGIHGEAAEYTQTLPKLDSALEEEWKKSHDRFIRSLRGSGKVGAKYFLLHGSSSPGFNLLWRDFQPTKLVDVWGRPLKFFLEENGEIFNWAIGQPFIVSSVKHMYNATVEEYAGEIMGKKGADWITKNQGKEPDESLKKKWEEEAKSEAVEKFKERFLKVMEISDETYGSERVGYYLMAKWMQDGRKCPKVLREMWRAMTRGGNIETKVWREKEGYTNWVPAVTAAYTWGHFNPEKCDKWPEDMEMPEDPKPILEKHNLWMAFETPMVGAGEEEAMRLGRPTDMYEMVIRLGTKYACLAIDWEHQLSGNINPLDEIKNLPEDGGKWVRVIHAGYPAVVAPAHVPIPLGSDAQMYAYKLLWELRKKWFKDGWIIFERGGGQEPLKETVVSLRLVIKYLERDIPPGELPEEFFGFGKPTARWTRQLVAVREHALDPIKGMLSVPEAEYGFLGTAAAAKGKLEEWKKEKYK